MISLAAFDQSAAARREPRFAGAGAAAVAFLANLLLSGIENPESRILDVAQFYSWKRECDGSETPCFELIKAVGSMPAGSVLPLPQLRELLGMKGGAK